MQVWGRLADLAELHYITVALEPPAISNDGKGGDKHFKDPWFLQKVPHQTPQPDVDPILARCGPDPGQMWTKPHMQPIDKLLRDGSSHWPGDSKVHTHMHAGALRCTQARTHSGMHMVQVQLTKCE